MNTYRMIGVLAWLAEQLVTFGVTFWRVQRAPGLQYLRVRTGVGLAVAKASAQCINLSLALVLLSMCRWTMANTIGRWLRVGNNVKAHRIFAFTAYFWTAVHVLSHYANFARLHDHKRLAHELLLSPVGATGHAMLLVMLLIVLTACWKRLWRWSFEGSLLVHNLLVFVLTGLLGVHGVFCYVRTFDGKCSQPTSGYWLVGPSALLWFDFAMRWLTVWWQSRRCRLDKAVMHPGGVVELQIQGFSRSYTCGQYVDVWIPQCSRWQRHPFTITSVQEEQSALTVHVQPCGRWTKRLQTLVTMGTPLTVGIDGPYGDVFSRIFKYPVAVLVGAGIGQTPYLSVLKTIWYHPSCFDHKW